MFKQYTEWHKMNTVTVLALEYNIFIKKKTLIICNLLDSR